jgi:hypothetical protein
MELLNHPNTFAVCLTHCYKCRKLKNDHPHLKTITIKNSIRGLGDIISIITYYLHIPHCSSCEKRRNILNEKFPLKCFIPLKRRFPNDKIHIRSIIKNNNVSKFPVIFNYNIENNTYTLLNIKN